MKFLFSLRKHMSLAAFPQGYCPALWCVMQPSLGSPSLSQLQWGRNHSLRENVAHPPHAMWLSECKATHQPTQEESPDSFPLCANTHLLGRQHRTWRQQLWNFYSWEFKPLLSMLKHMQLVWGIAPDCCFPQCWAVLQFPPQPQWRM